jgi:uncharacterized Zn finger protein
MFSLLLILLAQVGSCAPNDLSTVCRCKQGQLSACEGLRQTDPRLADQLEKATAQIQAMEAQSPEGSPSQAASSASREPTDNPAQPECTGQQHHIISRPIAAQLEKHPTLTGIYKPRDPRFISRAKDEKAHCGYQDWHRKVDDEVIRWLIEHEKATARQFEDFLRSIYSRPEMRQRFPNGF